MVQIKEPKLINSLFKQILAKYQRHSQNEDESSVNAQALTLWLKQVLRVHWITLVKQSG